MSLQRLLLPVLMTGLLGLLWGCTPAPQTAEKSIEVRISKLEKELKASQDDAMAKAAQLRLEQTKTAKLETERNELNSALKLRTGERDAVAVQYDGFRKTIKELLGQADAAANAKPGDSLAAGLPADGGQARR